MKFRINNPAFLQMACGKQQTPLTRMILTENSGGKVQLSANGLVIVEYIQDGEIVRNTYSELSNTYVPIPAGVEATIYGEVTVINYDEDENIFSSLDVSKNTALIHLYCAGCTGLTSLDVSKSIALTFLACAGCTGLTSLDLSKNSALAELGCNGCTGLTSLDVSKNPALKSLYCNDCTGLTSLDLSKNTALLYLYCTGCTGLMLLDIQNTQALDDGEFLDQSMANLTTLQVAGTSAFAYEQVESWLSDFSPNDGKLYIDENTPQSVITEAEAKNWTIEYVDA